MTRHDLQQIRHLNNEILILREHLAELELQIGCGAIAQDGQPKGNMIGRPTEQQAIKIAEQITIIHTMELELQELKLQTWAFVAALDDSLLRQIIVLRFIDGKNWVEVASAIGGNVTPDNCRMIYARANIEEGNE